MDRQREREREEYKRARETRDMERRELVRSIAALREELKESRENVEEMQKKQEVV